MESTTISGVSCVEIVRRVSSKMTGYYVYFNLAQAYYTTMWKATIQSDITSIVRHPKIQVWANLNDFLKIGFIYPLILHMTGILLGKYKVLVLGRAVSYLLLESTADSGIVL